MIVTDAAPARAASGPLASALAGPPGSPADAPGWPAVHVIGVALYPFEAHAWVELDGEPIDEVDGYLRRFTVIQRA